jgi:hypothetical protein
VTSISLISMQATALSLLWLVLLFGSGCLLITVIGGVVFADRRYWLGALVLVVADLLLGAVIAVLDHMGLAH